MGQPMEVRDTFRAAPVGSCIYCGATDRLSDEHIVPLALGGRFVLPDSSCSKCAAITSKFEQRVLRGFMLHARSTGAFPTRRPKERPKSLPIEIERNGVVEQVELLPKDHPALLHLPLLYPPGVLVGRDLSEGVSVCGHETMCFGKNPVDVANNLGVKTIRTTTDWDVSAFARLLAKIAYSYAVAAVGLMPQEDVPILPLILGTSNDASYWLGSENFNLTVEAKNPTHALAHRWVPDPNNAGTKLLLVRIKLFVTSGATGYLVVVCRPKPLPGVMPGHAGQLSGQV